MAARKVQAEIERVAKKISEGVAEFNEVLLKMEGAPNLHMANKYESLLKTEIKKLQRHRDTMKQFASSPDVKDKTFVTEQRKLVEQYMERFKAIEKEMKTKTFSKEGLMQSDKIDPHEKEKNETRDWIRNVIDMLHFQIDQKEAEAEGLGINKKKKDPVKLKKLEEIKSKVDRHKYHIDKLELILRMLENEHLKPDQVNNIKEDVSAYVNQEEYPDYDEPEWMYDDLNIDDENIYDVAKTLEEQALYLEQLEDEKLYCEPEKKSKVNRTITAKSEEKASIPKESVVTKVIPGKSPAPKEEEKEATTAKKPAAAIKEPKKVPEPLTIKKNNGQNKSNDEVAETRSMAQIISAALPEKHNTPNIRNNGTSTPMAKSQTDNPADFAAAAKASQFEPKVAPSVQSAVPSNGNQKAQNDPNQSEPQKVKVEAYSNVASPQTSNNSSQPEPKQIIQRNQKSAEKPSKQNPGHFEPTVNKMRFPSYLDDLNKMFRETKEKSRSYIELLLKARSSTSLNERSLDAAGAAQGYFDKMLQVGHIRHINETDLDPPRSFFPNSQYDTPYFYPTQPLGLLKDPNFIEKLDADTLFFIFYFQKGTYMQYCAAKQLQKKYKYNGKFNMWFYRQDKPEVTTNTYELGSFTFFDYNDTWTERTESRLKMFYSEVQDPIPN